MFKVNPKILAHKAAVSSGNYVTPEFILNNNTDSINLFHRYCPHRMFPLHETGDIVQNVFCNFHGFEWSKTGEPLNNNKKITCGQAEIGRSGLVLKDFKEPDAPWVDDLAAETNLVYSHTISGHSKGSWLWIMEVQADLLHIRTGQGAVHPDLSEITDLGVTSMTSGDGWALQTCSTGWWLCIYPYTFVEWSKGCLAINYAVPDNRNDEFGFTWTSQFYYDPETTDQRRKDFEKYFQDVLVEDIAAIEKQKGKYFPLRIPHNHLEDHCVHFGQWVTTNLLKNKLV